MRRRGRLQIAYEDQDILVVNKPPGLLTSTVPREKRPTLLKMVQEYVYQQNERAQVGLIHRLDRDAAGLLIFSKNHQAYLSLKQQFFKHSVDRIYQATVHGTPNPREGKIDSHLVERADGTVYSTDQRGKGERAITHYETVESTGKQSTLRVKLETGKKHQIRVHLAERGVPIVNDPVYCNRIPSGNLKLVAAELTVDHPRTRKRMTFSVEAAQRSSSNSE